MTTCTASVDGQSVTGVIVESLDDLVKLREPWQELLAASSSDSAFLTWEWLCSWSELFIRGDRRLLVIAISAGSSVIGIAPLYIGKVGHGPLRVREIGFLGLPEAGSDYLDVIAKKRKERLVARALLALLFGPLSPRWDLFALNEIPADSAFLAHLVAQLRLARKHYAIDEGSFCPCVELPETFDAYLTQLSGHARQAYRRKMRSLLASGDVEHVMFNGRPAVSEALPAFRALYEKRWGRNAEDLFELMTRYLSRIGDAWHVELSLLKVQGTPVAGLLHLAKGSKKYQYLMAVDRQFNKSLSLGSLICAMNIKQAIESGCSEYDFLKSGEDYKLQLMNRARRAMNIRVHNRTLRSLSVWTARTASGLGKILLR